MCGSAVHKAAPLCALRQSCDGERKELKVLDRIADGTQETVGPQRVRHSCWSARSIDDLRQTGGGVGVAPGRSCDEAQELVHAACKRCAHDNGDTSHCDESDKQPNLPTASSSVRCKCTLHATGHVADGMVRVLFYMAWHV